LFLKWMEMSVLVGARTRAQPWYGDQGGRADGQADAENGDANHDTPQMAQHPHLPTVMAARISAHTESNAWLPLHDVTTPVFL